jgi:hypothetical protein
MENDVSNRNSDGGDVEPRLRAFWVFYPDIPSTHGREAWAALGAKELVHVLNRTYPFEHTLYNVSEITCEELNEPDGAGTGGGTIAAALEAAHAPGMMFERYSPLEPHPTSAMASS